MALIGFTSLTIAYEGDEVVFRGAYVIEPTASERRVPLDFSITGNLWAIIQDRLWDLEMGIAGFAAGTGEPELRGELRASCPASEFKQRLQTIGIDNYGTAAGPIPASITAYFAQQSIGLEFRISATATPDVGAGAGGLNAVAPAI